MRACAGLAAILAIGACRKPSAEASRSLASANENPTQDAAASEAVPHVLPARCKSTGRGRAISEGAAAGDLEIGDALAYPGGYAVGLVRRSAVGRVAAAALLEPGANLVLSRVVELGFTPGDAPPPRLVWRSGELLVAAYGVAGGDADADQVRELMLYTLSPSSNPRLLLSVPQRRDDSLAFDMASNGHDAIVVWDEAPRAGHGVVREAVVGVGARSVRPRDISSAESDAELPRLVANGSGYSALWIARAPEPGVLLDGSGQEVGEAIGEPRAFGWIESIELDEQGEPFGPVRTLTPHNGHVSGFDVQRLAGAPTSTLLVVARDDGEAKDGSGGALFRVRVQKDTVEPVVAYAIDGLGRGAPTLVPFAPAPEKNPTNPSGLGTQATNQGTTQTANQGTTQATNQVWLTWVGAHEQLQVLPLDLTGAPRGLPSAEEDMNDARPLLFLPQDFLPQEEGGARMQALAAAPSKEDAQLRIFACTP
ncbi:MAG TPA: hypothetical protein VGY54_02170 [Polyangiaceae bacterium]|nr:hypothetical protein [Polyangiaceae bacterium]